MVLLAWWVISGALGAFLFRQHCWKTPPTKADKIVALWSIISGPSVAVPTALYVIAESEAGLVTIIGILTLVICIGGLFVI